MTDQTTPHPSSSGRAPSATEGGTGVTAPSHLSHVGPLLRALAAATAALLAVDAYVHLRDAGLYDAFNSSTLSEGTLFRGQAIAAIVVAIALLVRPRPVVWLVAAVVAASAVAAVLLYTYVDVGAVGPLPDLYEPTWALPGKAGSAIAETGATVLALAGLTVSMRTRRRAVT
jgi:hypothetical protein